MHLGHNSDLNNAMDTTPSTGNIDGCVYSRHSFSSEHHGIQEARVAGELMAGADLRLHREAQRLGQQEFAAWLNDRLGRKYDKQRISRWETGAERIPQTVVDLVREAEAAPTFPAELAPNADAGHRAIVVAVALQKGGAAKTTTTINLAYKLASLGWRVLVVDADPQANATSYLGADPVALGDSGRTLAEVLEEKLTLGQILVPVCGGLFDLAPSSITLSEIEALLATDSTGDGVRILRDEIRGRDGDGESPAAVGVAGLYDFVLIDCPPHLGTLTTSGLIAAHYVLVPTQTETFSAMGIPLLLRTILRLRKRANRNLQILGILPTCYSARFTNDALVLKHIQDTHGESFRIYPPVPRSTLYSQSTTEARPPLDLFPQIPGREVFHAIAADLIGLAKQQTPETAHVA
jgi:chromosome partitioning protein